jgi:hypothetical protein
MHHPAFPSRSAIPPPRTLQRRNKIAMRLGCPRVEEHRELELLCHGEQGWEVLELGLTRRVMQPVVI